VISFIRVRCRSKKRAQSKIVDMKAVAVASSCADTDTDAPALSYYTTSLDRAGISAVVDTESYHEIIYDVNVEAVDYIGASTTSVAESTTSVADSDNSFIEVDRSTVAQRFSSELDGTNDIGELSLIEASVTAGMSSSTARATRANDWLTQQDQTLSI